MIRGFSNPIGGDRKVLRSRRRRLLRPDRLARQRSIAVTSP